MSQQFSLSQILEHTVLAPDATDVDIVKGAEIATIHGCAAIVVRPYWVSLAKDNSGVPVCSVIGFPFGEKSTSTKVSEIESAIQSGATELDVVMNWKKLIDGERAEVLADLVAMRKASPGVLMKVIIESAALSTLLLKEACLLSEEAGAEFVKTSSGYHEKGGATRHAVELMATAVPSLGVKASGGIKTLGLIEEMLAAGATRIGTSATASILGPAA